MQCVVTLQWASVEHGRMAVRGAPKRAGHALLSTFFSLFPTFNILLPVPYFGSPLQSGQALLSTLFSLFSTFEHG